MGRLFKRCSSFSTLLPSVTGVIIIFFLVIFDKKRNNKKMGWFQKRKQAATINWEAKMNGFTDSQDVSLNQPLHTDQSLQAKMPKQPTLWKRLRQKCRKCDKNRKGSVNIEHSVKEKLSESSGNQDVVLNQSVPANKPKKPTLWKRLKHNCKRRDKKKKGCGNNEHTVNFEPGVMNVSLEVENVEPQKKNGLFEEELLTDAKVKAYLDSHRDVLFEYLHCRHHVLCGYVHEQVPIETIKSWLTTKEGSSLSQSEDYETAVCGNFPGSSLSQSEDDESAVCGNFPGSSLSQSEDDESDDSEDQHLVELDMIENWEIISKIGEGGCGIVHKAQNNVSKQEVVVKEARRLKYARQLRDEAEMMKSLDHKNILKFIDIVEYPEINQVFLILEYVDGDSLFQQLHMQKKFTETQARPFMKQMASAFAYMHSQNIVHRDIKLGNVLYSKGVVKVIDFGLAVFFKSGEKISGNSGTPGYMAPEMSNVVYDGPPVDVWALGILFTKLFLGLKLHGRKIIEILHDKNDFIVVYSLPPSASDTLVSLLTGMIRKIPQERLTMQEIVNHPWFEENRLMEC